jgi:site-specific recombinase XerD
MKISLTFSELLQAFFTERLMKECNASANTIANYRDTFRLLIAYAQRRLKKHPHQIATQDLDVSFILRFLDYLENERGNSPRSRNVRLAAIHSFFTYATLQEPAVAGITQRVLAIQTKRCAKKPVDYLCRTESDALLSAPDQTTWSGRRDRTLLSVALQTGLRVAELIGLRCRDVVLETGAHVRCTGKGRKTRSVPLRKEVVSDLRHWFRERNGQPDDPVFPNARGRTLSRDGVEYILRQHVDTARAKCPSLKTKRVTAHVLRHSTAMNLLQHGVDRSVIALWLGHESMETTQVYLHANLELKERALAKTEPFSGRNGRYRPPEQILAFLNSL